MSCNEATCILGVSQSPGWSLFPRLSPFIFIWWSKFLGPHSPLDYALSGTISNFWMIETQLQSPSLEGHHHHPLMITFLRKVWSPFIELSPPPKWEYINAPPPRPLSYLLKPNIGIFKAVSLSYMKEKLWGEQFRTFSQYFRDKPNNTATNTSL